MLSDIFRLFFKSLIFLPSFALSALSHRISAFVHSYTYKPLPPGETKNVVVIGGSFAGFIVTKRLAETLPTGYRVILVERNSHLNYLFAFPRFSVAKGNEEFAFIPYDGLAAGAPEGIFDHVRDTAVDIREDVVELERGRKLAYEFLVIATGTSSGLPSKVAATDSLKAQEELKDMQRKIEEARRTAVIGGGAVGVEIASDVKDFYPEKEVVLFHSREQLLPSFGPRLHGHVATRMEELGVKVVLGERPVVHEDGKSLRLRDGDLLVFDLIVSPNMARRCEWVNAHAMADSLHRATTKFVDLIHAFAIFDIKADIPRSRSADATNNGCSIPAGLCVR
jgi:NAD(P)H-nitrite reductase large subunit